MQETIHVGLTDGPRASPKSPWWLSGELEIPTRPMRGDKWVEGFEVTLRRACWPACHSYSTGVGSPYSSIIRAHLWIAGILANC